MGCGGVGVVNRYSRLGVTRAAGIHNRKVVNIGTRVSDQESREHRDILYKGI